MFELSLTALTSSEAPILKVWGLPLLEIKCIENLPVFGTLIMGLTSLGYYL